MITIDDIKDTGRGTRDTSFLSHVSKFRVSRQKIANDK